MACELRTRLLARTPVLSGVLDAAGAAALVDGLRTGTKVFTLGFAHLLFIRPRADRFSQVIGDALQEGSYTFPGIQRRHFNRWRLAHLYMRKPGVRRNL